MAGGKARRGPRLGTSDRGAALRTTPVPDYPSIGGHSIPRPVPQPRAGTPAAPRPPRPGCDTFAVRAANTTHCRPGPPASARRSGLSPALLRRGEREGRIPGPDGGLPNILFGRHGGPPRAAESESGNRAGRACSQGAPGAALDGRVLSTFLLLREKLEGGAGPGTREPEAVAGARPRVVATG